MAYTPVELKTEATTVEATAGFDTVGGQVIGISKLLLGAATVDGGLVSSANPLPISDAAGTLTVDAPAGTPVFVRLSDGSSAVSAATSGKQDTGNTSLASLDTKTPSLGQALSAASVPVVLTAAQVTTLTPPAAISGFATSANQATEIASLASIDGKTPALGQALAAASVPVVLTASQLSTLTPLSTVAVTGVATAAKQDTLISSLSSIDGHVDGVEGSLGSIDAKITAVNTGAVVIASSALPTGAATAARQDTGNTSLGSIDGKTPALGQALAAASVPVVLTAAQLATLTPLTTIAVTGTFWQGTQPVSGTFWQATQPVSLAAGATAIAKAEDVASADADVGVPAMAVRKATPANTSGTDGDYEMLQMSAGRLWVDASGVTLTVGSHAVTNAGTFAVQDSDKIADDAAFSVASSKVQPSGYMADETSTDSVDEGDCGIARMTLNRIQIVTPYAHTAGGCSLYSFLSTAAVQAAAVKASAGQVYGLHFFNVGAAAVYLRLYNMTSTPGTGDTVVYRATIPGNTAGAGYVVHVPPGVEFTTGIGIRVSAAIADNDNTSLSANGVMGNVLYK